MCTRERALELGQTLENIEKAEKEIAEYEKEHGKPMSETGKAALRLKGLVVVNDERLFL